MGLGGHRRARGRMLGALALLAAFAARAEDGRLEVEVIDREGEPVPNVAVYAVPLDASHAPLDRAPRPAVVDQRNRAFVPHVLVVETGTEIHFPNSDSLSHHVYSFSPTKSFELPLYRQGTIHPPLLFDVPGLVTLGCNIHDDMIGYVLVVDTPYFAVTDGAGAGALAGLPSGRYRVHVWTARLRPSALPEPFEVDLTGGPQELAIRFAAKLAPAHAAGAASLKWSTY